MLLQVISFSLVLGAHEYVGKILSRYNVKKYGSVGTVDFLPWLLLFFSLLTSELKAKDKTAGKLQSKLVKMLWL